MACVLKSLQLPCRRGAVELGRLECRKASGHQSNRAGVGILDDVGAMEGTWEAGLTTAAVNLAGAVGFGARLATVEDGSMEES